MSILHRRAFMSYTPGPRQCRELPPDSPYIPEDKRVPAEPESALRAVAVEPPAASSEPSPEPFTAVVAIVKATVAETLREREEGRNRLNEIASLVRSLTYGDMVQLAEAIWTTNAGVELTQEALPAALHRWATKGRERE